MTTNIATTKERIVQFIDYKGIDKKTFFKETGIKRGFLDADKLKSTVSDVFLANIIANYNDVNLSWLLTGIGEMTNEPNNVSSEFTLRTDNKLNNQLIPLYNLEATAGLVQLFENQKSLKPIDTLQIPNLPKCDGAVFVTGDSMYPILKSGDIVAYKQIHDMQNNIFWGEMYLVSLNIEGEEYVSVKYVQKSDKSGEYIKLVSHNSHHQPKDVHLSKVSGLAIVKASVRINSMQ